MAYADTKVNDGETTESGNFDVVNVSSLSSLTIHQFLSHFGLNHEITTPLSNEGINDVETLFECDMADIVSITKKFS